MRAGQTVEVYLGFDADAQERDTICIYSLDETAMAAAAAWLQAGAPQDLAIREGGAIDLTAEGSPEKDLLVLPFAWEDAAHWQLTVNGEAAVLEPVFGGWMGVRLQPGAQTVRLRYRPPPAQRWGLAGSGAAVLAALGWRVAEKTPRTGRRKPQTGERGNAMLYVYLFPGAGGRSRQNDAGKRRRGVPRAGHDGDHGPQPGR